MAETIEQVQLLFPISASRMVFRKAIDQLAHARAQLIREVRRRGTDELVDLLDDRVRHSESVTAHAPR